MSLAPLHGIRACVFDAYGTLFDVAAAARTCSAELGEKSSALSSLWREKQLQYTWLRALQGRHADFWQVTGEALDFALETLRLSGSGLRDRLLSLYLTLDVFPEVRDTLARLKQAGMRTAILSNGSPHMLHPRVYQLAVERLGLEAGAIAFQSSNAWDAWAASAFGMRVVWCNRYDQRPEKLPGRPDREIRSLAELPALLGLN